MSDQATDIQNEPGADAQTQDSGQGQEPVTTDGGAPHLLDVSADEPQDNTKPPSWREDWRIAMATAEAGSAEGEAYEKALNRLQRFASPEDVWKSYRNAESKLSSGQVKPELPPNPTDEQLAEWRAANNIPPSPEEYKLDLPEGTVLGEEDKPYVDSFLKFAHEANLSNEAASAAINWYLKDQAEREQAIAQQDAEQRDQTRDALRDKWGGDYQANMNALRGFLGEQMIELLGSARLADGTAVFNHPQIVEAFVNFALDGNPSPPLIGPGVPLTAQSVDDRLAELNEKMKNPREFTQSDREERMRLLDWKLNRGGNV